MGFSSISIFDVHDDVLIVDDQDKEHTKKEIIENIIFYKEKGVKFFGVNKKELNLKFDLIEAIQKYAEEFFLLDKEGGIYSKKNITHCLERTRIDINELNKFINSCFFFGGVYKIYDILFKISLS